MLSSSIEATNQEIDLLPIATGSGDPILSGGTSLIEFVNATLAGTGTAAARSALVNTLGGSATTDAAAVIGNFEMMNRIADGVGMPVGKGTRQRMADVIDRLSLAAYPHAQA